MNSNYKSYIAILVVVITGSFSLFAFLNALEIFGVRYDLFGISLLLISTFVSLIVWIILVYVLKVVDVRSNDYSIISKQCSFESDGRVKKEESDDTNKKPLTIFWKNFGLVIVGCIFSPISNLIVLFISCNKINTKKSSSKIMIIIVSLVLFCFPSVVTKVNSTTIGHLSPITFALNNDVDDVVSKIEKEVKEIIIPSYYKGKKVVEIAPYASFGNKTIESLVVPGTVKTIGDGAFSDCVKLKKVVLKNGVEEIGDIAFYDCGKFVKLEVPKTIKKIGNDAFGDSIDFEASYITKVKGICYLGNPINKYTVLVQATPYAPRVITVDRRTKVIMYQAFDCKNNCFPDKVIMPKGLKSIGERAFSYSTYLNTIEIPDTVESIGDYAFEGTYLSYVSLPDSLQELGVEVFTSDTLLGNGTKYNNGLYIGNPSNPYLALTQIIDKEVTDFEMHSQTRIIIENCFSMCMNIEEITVPQNVVFVGYNAFSELDSLKTVNILGKIKNIKDNTFSNCSSLETVILPSCIETIGRCAFSQCESLKRIDIPSSCKCIDMNAFYGCDNLVEMNYKGNINDWLKIDFKNECSNPLYYAHNLYINGELITDLEIDKSVTEIKKYSFYGCTSITVIILHSQISYIGPHAFECCSNLSKIIYEGTWEQFLNIEKAISWDYDISYKIECFDETIKIR